MAEHNTLTGTSLHEPKGVAAASVGQVYRADGAGSGNWETPPVATHGEMLVTSYTTAFAVPLAVDSTLATDSDYVKVTAASMWSAGHLHNIAFNVDELIVPADGDYEVNFWASLEVSAVSTTVAVKYAINDSTPYSTRKILTKSKVTGDVENLGGMGLVSGLSAGDTISLYVAADVACNIIGREAGLTVKLLEAT